MNRPKLPIAWVAAGLGLASAATSAYWAVGGTWLLDTIGGELERWGRERGAPILVALWAIVLVKSAVALAAPVLAGVGEDRLPCWTSGRIARTFGWAAAVTLTLYGGFLTVGGLLVINGVLDIGTGEVSKAFAWHAYLWDPWFALWGLALGTTLWLSRPRVGSGRYSTRGRAKPAPLTGKGVHL